MTPAVPQPQPTVPPRIHALKTAKKPQVPDHEVMRCIGRGSYGEVWLARGVTGAWRAVKVVRREDFELDRTFEREFQGILSFEPISRDHEGLVDILHVGRNVEEGFYFYVMELADDREAGLKINVVDYEPHTLSSDKTRKVKLTLDRVVEIGISLADALTHLHDRGLSHRDIKPSNIIFVQGRAKLADIGLVARAGQQTFVGTEGFVPPEGPGTGSADIYSLGMVLYEVSTGKDRLCFPELAEEPGDPKEKKRRRMLNEVICKACDPNPKRRFGSAKHLSDALRQVRRGKYHRPILPRAVALFGLSGVAAFGIVWSRNHTLPWPPGAVADRNTPPVTPVVRAPDPSKSGAAMASVRFETEPVGAQVWSGSKLLGKTPLDLKGLTPGKFVFHIKQDKYRTEEVPLLLEAGGILPVRMTLQFAPPETGHPWENAAGMSFKPKGDWHESETPVTYDQFLAVMRFAPADVITAGNAVRIPPEDAQAFCEALLQKDLDSGHLEVEQHFYRPHVVQLPSVEPAADDAKDHIIFHCILQKREFGDIVLESDPPGAAIFDGEKKIGTTPKSLLHHQTGPFEYTVKLLGYDDLKVPGNLESKQKLVLKVPLVKSRQASLGVAFENSLGMKFNPVGPMLVAIWETRVKDFDAFVAGTDPQAAHSVSWPQTPDHPVARLNREQCQNFCRWLTEKEQKEGLLPKNLEYRLPTDEEWSMAADLPERKQNQPAERDKGARANYVWGVNIWPPPREKEQMPGNFSDMSRIKLDKDGKQADKDAKRELTLEKEKYDDGYAYTAPVGCFVPNRFGLFDLAGNVAEWVIDNYGGDYPNHGVTRGGSWADGKQEDGKHPMLLASSRNAIKPDLQDPPYGFRCVIAAKKE